MRVSFKFLCSLVLVFSIGSATAKNIQEIKVKPKHGTVALTFDDGPDPAVTPRILEILKKYNVKATFFVIAGPAKSHPDLIKKIVAEGHVVANHSMTHPMLTKVSSVQLQKEVVQSRDIIGSISGYAPNCFRPPFGDFNHHVKETIQENGMALVTWDFLSLDYERRGVEWIQNFVMKNIHDRSIFVMHDSGANNQAVGALPGIIDGIRKKGLEFDTICR
jgi:peptidoglycan/xylan/chitin deacetylase (PgdA/CDA1 family)